jgi:uncharacterized protein
VRVTELRSDETALRVAKAITLFAGLAACLWQPAFYLFVGTFAVGVVAWLIQRRFIYRPTKRRYRPPSSLDLKGVSEIWLNSPDGEQLLTWQSKPRHGMPTILYLHGNNYNLSNRLQRVSGFLDDGYGLMILSFRGYGLSTGRPSETSNVNDALLAYDALHKNGVASGDIIVYGESLGSGVAVQLAANRPIGALVLEAPYTSLHDLVRHRLRVIPAYTFLMDEYNSVEHIKKVTAPLLIVHSLADDIIPIAFGRWLFEAATGPKEFLRIRGAKHSGLFRAGGWPKIRAFIEKHLESAGNFGPQARETTALKLDASATDIVTDAGQKIVG